MGFNSAQDNVALDAEHQVQLGLVTGLEQALRERRPASEVDEILDRLVSYTDAHFMAEQLLMRLHGYPHYQAHQQEHDHLVEQIRELERRYRADEIALSLDTVDSLKAWLLGHTRQADQALADYLDQRA
jgi:hemerythrin